MTFHTRQKNIDQPTFSINGKQIACEAFQVSWHNV